MESERGFWAPLARDLAHPRSLLLLLLGVVCLFAATIWEIRWLQTPEQLRLEVESHWFDNPKVWFSLIREVGFASFVALAVALVIEAGERHRQETATKERQQVIAESVFRGVFENNLPPELVAEVVDHVLKAQLVRLEHTCTYAFSDAVADVAGKKIQYVELTSTSNYLLQNVSSERTSVPIRFFFPQPGDPRLRGLERLNSVQIGDEVLSTERITEGDRAIPDTDFLRCFQWIHALNPGEKVRVITQCRLIKERSDTEVWNSLYPSVKMKLAIDMHCEGLDFGVRALHRKQIGKIAGGVEKKGHHEYEITDPVLPNQGMVVWWRLTTPTT